jgi:hypothetical protein
MGNIKLGRYKQAKTADYFYPSVYLKGMSPNLHVRIS